ncbi:carbohydrate ABC transporter permease [Paenibacillus pasadenensis]|uniref:N-Acetyl-D-glucosamine ABC transport system, permease protein 1 n=1 Tax=Paenibacillus pasadenensis TaxID=217090 RepID=A0A2N5N506_9BACL|nr:MULTISPECIES: sugar ABC transporter permease [Paenibacillus]PLT45403.1 N-Acetyl-D-glucosamine ABC transport system, permease protein 1 [Paenibacillus pasadenensis]QGG55791.1 ABC transporter permease subunit [Paenibacillus sp. B01]
MQSQAVKRTSGKKAWKEWAWGWFFIAPTIVGLVVLNLIPMAQSAYLSFFKSGDFGRNNIYVGLDNYRKLVQDAQVWHAVANTLLYAAIVVPVSIALAMLIAVLLNQKIAGRSAYRTIYFIPMIAAPAAVTMVWRWMYNQQFGLFNYVLSKFGLPPVDWISNPRLALVSIAVIGIWSVVGYNMVLLLAGLQEIPKDYYEASDIDGAGRIRQFFVITLPLVTPTLFFVVVTSVIQAMQVFDVIFMMIDVTNPAYDHTVSLVYLFYNSSFKYMDRGYGSAIVMLLLALIMIITFFQMKAQKRWVHYQ